MYYIFISFQNWKKFGNSEFDAAGPNVATTTVSDDVFMTFISSKEVRIHWDSLNSYLCIIHTVCALLCVLCDWVPYLTSCRTWTPQTRMKIPWTNWKDRRLCLAVFAKATIGPPVVRTRTPWARCRRSWLNSLGLPPETRPSPLALVPSAHRTRFRFVSRLAGRSLKSDRCGPLCFFHQESQSWRSLRRARLGSMCPRVWGMEARAEGSPCSPTGEAGVSWSSSSSAALILHLIHCPVARALLRINSTCMHSTADDNATIRVTNLSEDTRETDLQELFRPFGSISRIYLAKDKNTGQSKVSVHLKNSDLRMDCLRHKYNSESIKAGVLSRVYCRHHL